MRTQHQLHTSGTLDSPAALTQIGDTFDLFGECQELTATVSNDGAALTDFSIQFRNKNSGSWVTLVSGSEWADTDKMLKLWNNPAALNTLADGAIAGLQLSLGPVYQLRFLANSSGETTVTIDAFATI